MDCFLIFSYEILKPQIFFFNFLGLTQAAWVWQPCANILSTKTQSTVDLHRGFSKL
jgi:hypothetical protein